MLTLRVAAWWASLAAVLLWLMPSLALAASALLLDRLRFRLALGLGRALMAAGWPGVASRIYVAEMGRTGRHMRALRRRSP